MSKALAVLTLGALTIVNNHASVLYNETFSYPDGSLTNVSGGTWAAHSGGGVVPVQVSLGQAILAQGSGTREDVNRSTGGTMGPGDTWYAGFDVTVSGGSTPVYFAHFLETSTTFGGRVFVTNSPTAGDFRFALSGGSSTANAIWASDSSFGASYRVVVSYDYDTGNCLLWVNAAQDTDPSISSVGFSSDAMYGFAFRQAAGNSTQVIDNLIVGTTFADVAVVPEPSTLALGGFGLLALLMARRRN